MRILLVHTFYQIKGGEDSVFRQEIDLLSKSHEVQSITFQNRTGWRGAIQFLISIWNISNANILRRKIVAFKPDIIHIHNLHFAIGPIAILVAKKFDIPVVLTLHNFRLLCPSGILQHKGSLFLSSLTEPFPWKAVRNRVYRNSYFQTFWLSLIVWFHRQIGTWIKVDQYIVLTDFAKELFLNSVLNINVDSISVKPNFIEKPSYSAHPRNNTFLFVGRLMEEKGIACLINAFKDSGNCLKIAGSGPLLNLVEETCANYKNFEYLGNLDKVEVLAAMQKCTALVFPSTWYEGMPMTILEAFSLGTPVIASNLGAMQTMIRDNHNGLLFKPGDSGDLQKSINYWSSLSEDVKYTFRENAKQTFEEKYTAKINNEILKRIYNRVLD
ncbi:glycosyltransferase [Dyadobacter sp. CY312]|uniref:glycosyltransferase n=1 Tax=Dyadobacter sp. CY312 TaxID=2907303 RepID=UPI001F3F6292|nr:glycosyltransferase [Dyadobacter sp. CY312]MCE7040498.1 glycosyltransferase [Dyadobacter sp. CY312]